VEVLAEEGGVTEVAWDGVARRFGADIDSRALVEQAVDTAVASLGGKPMSTGLYTVLIHPRVGTQLLSLLAQALSAEAVQNGRSFLKDRLGERVASPCVTLVDDSRRERGLSSLAYDDEGTAALPMNMIENGTLKNYFYDIRTAHRAGIKSNGRGFRSSPASAPSPQPTNFSIAAGTSTLAELTSAEKTVFLLHDIMGLHMAEPVTGEFSLGAAGFLYTNGKFARPVRGMTMAGTVGGLLQSIVAVGNDVHWASSFGAPYLLANGITLSGN
jgi:PmbA protein